MAVSHAGLDHANTWCRTCHTPHNSPMDDLLNPVENDLFAHGDGSACHDAPEYLTGIAAACVDSCHDDKEEGPEHRYAVGVKCTGCHSPHASRSASLLPDVIALCLPCHGDILHMGTDAGERVRRAITPTTYDYRADRCVQCHQSRIQKVH